MRSLAVPDGWVYFQISVIRPETGDVDSRFWTLLFNILDISAGMYIGLSRLTFEPVFEPDDDIRRL
jgi:hypothetical protein